MEITAKLVKDLREQTGAGMMKCKSALVECNGDFEAAVDYLRKKGLASADKRSGRATSEGLVTPFFTADRRGGAIVEVNCETDFVARNELFQEFARKLAEYVYAHPEITTLEALEKAPWEDGQAIEEIRKGMIAKIGENITIGRFERFALKGDEYGVFESYVHGDGNIGVLILVGADSAETAKKNEVVDFAHELALQIAAMKPLFVKEDEVPADVVAREKDVILGQIKNDAKNADKPENILEKIVEGRIHKFFKEICLIEQPYVKDDKKSINDFAADVGKNIGGKITPILFRRWAVGEASQGETAGDGEQEKSACCSTC